MSRRLLLPLLAVLLVGAAAPAAHAAGWVASGPLSPGDRVAAGQQITVTPAGERVLAWIQNGANGFSPENVSIRTAPPGGDFGPAQTFPGGPSGLEMIAASDGTLALAWLEFGTRTIHVARRAPGQTAFVEATPLVLPNGEAPAEVDVAFNGNELVGVTASVVPGGGRVPRSIWAFHLPADATAMSIVNGPDAGGSLEHVANAQGQPEAFLNSVSIAVSAGRTVALWQNQTNGPFQGQTQVNNRTQVKWSQRVPGTTTFNAPFIQDTTTNDGFFDPDMDPNIAGSGGNARDVWVEWTRERSSNVFAQDITAPVALSTIPSPGFIGRDSVDRKSTRLNS